MDIWEYIADLDYCPSCDECYAQQSYCEEHSE